MTPRTLRNWIYLGLLSITAMAMACRCFGQTLSLTAYGEANQDVNEYTDWPANAGVFYCSNSEGDDANDGLTTSTPKQTLSAVKALVTGGAGDHVLLKRGDTWTDENWGQVHSGADVDNPFVLGAYGTGDRPKIRTVAGGNFSRSVYTGGGYIVFQSLDISPNGRALSDDGQGIEMNLKDSPGYILIEDCKIDGYDENLNIYAPSDTSVPLTNVTIRKCTIINAWSTNSHAQGMFTVRTKNVLIEDNTFDHNGWQPDWEDYAIMASGTTAAYTNGDTLTITCVRYGDFTDASVGNGLDLELIDLNDSSGTITSVTVNGDDIEVRADFTTGIASNTVASAIQAYNGGADFTCTSSGTANLVAADAGTQDNVTSGGSSADPTIFNHHIYVAEGGTNFDIASNTYELRGNVFTRASNHVAKLEPTFGTVSFHDNFCAFNGIGGQFGMGSNDIDVEVDGARFEMWNNVWTEMIPVANPGNGIGPTFQSVASGFFRNNILANRDPSDPDGSYAIYFGDLVDGVGINNMLIEDNIFYNTRNDIYLVDPHGYGDAGPEDNAEGDFTTPTVSGNTFKRNQVILPTGQTSSNSLMITWWLDPAEIVFEDNVYFSTGDPADEWFITYGGTPISTTTWQSTYEASATFTEPASPDPYFAPDRTSTTFATSHANGYADWDEWMNDLLAQHRLDNDNTIKAEAVNDYIRFGFSLPEYAEESPSNKRALILK